MNNIRIYLLSFFLIIPGSVLGFEVKGLTLGQVTSHQGLADLFGNADCRTSKIEPEYFGTTCTVPISYLGVATSAKINVSLQWVVNNIEIKYPEYLIPEVEKYLVKTYGQPNIYRGTKLGVVSGLKRLDGTEVPSFEQHEPCTRWSNLNDVQILLCQKYMFEQSNFLKFEYRNPSKLDESDT